MERDFKFWFLINCSSSLLFQGLRGGREQFDLVKQTTLEQSSTEGKRTKTVITTQRI